MIADPAADSFSVTLRARAARLLVIVGTKLCCVAAPWTNIEAARTDRSYLTLLLIVARQREYLRIRTLGATQGCLNCRVSG